MVPSPLLAEAVRLFLAIPESRIESDLAETPYNCEVMRLRVVGYYRLARSSPEKLTPEMSAEYLHYHMIWGCAALANPMMDEATAFYIAAMAARDTAFAVVQAAETKGELGELNLAMDRIAGEAGIDPSEGYDEKDMPEEYNRLAKEAGAWSGKIDRMMVVDILKRYRLHDMAELFEADEKAFSSRVQKGAPKLLTKERENEGE